MAPNTEIEIITQEKHADKIGECSQGISENGSL